MLRRYPPSHPLTHPSTHLQMHTSIHPPTYPCIPPSIHPPTHASLHQSTRLPMHPSIHPPVFHASIPPSFQPSIHSLSPVLYASIPPFSIICLPNHLSIYHSSIHPSIYSSTHSSTQISISPFSLSSTYPHLHPAIHLSTHQVITIHPFMPVAVYTSSVGQATPKHPLTLSSSPSPRPLFIHMLHFKMVNRTRSLPSQNLHVSDDHHDPRSTGLLLGPCLPNLAAPPSGPGHLQSKENKEPWMAFTLSLHLHDHISFPTSLIYFVLVFSCLLNLICIVPLVLNGIFPIPGLSSNSSSLRNLFYFLFYQFLKFFSCFIPDFSGFILLKYRLKAINF